MQPYIEDMASLCYPRTLQRARALAAKDANFMTRQAAVLPSGDAKVSAFVASSQGWQQHYKAEVELAPEGYIRDYGCTCPAFLNYEGMCKHSAALVMDYVVRADKYPPLTGARASLTSRVIAELMDQAPLARGGAGARAAEGVIELVPELRLEYDLWTLRLRIASPEASYVVRDIRRLVSDVHEAARVTYGKKLTLTHARSAFTKRSQQLIGLLEAVLDEGGGAPWRWGGYGSSRRDLALTPRDLIDFLDIMEGVTFMMESALTWMPRQAMVQISPEAPPLELRLVPDEGGYTVVRDTAAVVVASGRRAYALVDGMFYRCPDEAAPFMAALEPMLQGHGAQLFVSAEDAPRFCATLLPQLEAVAQVGVPAALEALRPVPGVVEFYFDKADDAVEAAAQVRYGARAVHLGGILPASAGEGGEGGGQDAPVQPTPMRDEALERAALQLLHEYFPADLRLPLADEEAVGDLLFGGLARFRQMGDVLTTPAFDRLLDDRKPRLALGISLSGDLLALDVTADDLSPEDLAALLASYRRKKRYHRLRSGAFLDVAALDLHQADVLMDDLGVTAEQLGQGRFELPTYRAFFLDREFADAHRNVAFAEYVERFRTIDPERYEVPEPLAGVLRPYQVEGFRWLSALADMGLAGILADEMGLGKSLQLISWLLAQREQLHEAGPALIVCPASLVYNWAAEFARFAPDMRVRTVAGTKRERDRVRADDEAEVLVTSYDLLRIDVKAYEGREFFACVLDEAQYIKNHATLTTRAVKRVQARHRLALTGTPMENRLSELWSIFDFLMPGFLGSYARFRERYELGIVGGDDELAARLQRLVGPFILRRRKAEVLDELPDKLESVVRVGLAPEQRKLYLASEQRLREELNRQKKMNASRGKRRGTIKESDVGPRVEVLAELTRLRQMALDPGLVLEGYHGGAAKVDAIMELVAEARESGQKMLLFSQFTTFLDVIARQLEEQGVPFFTITGATPKKRRVQLVDRFNADDTPVFLISLKAGGTGLNLTGASMVVHADPWWNVAAQDQATDRAHRIGQQATVNVYKVIAAGTIEERIVELQQKKAALADAVVGATGAEALSALTRDQLLELLG